MTLSLGMVGFGMVAERFHAPLINLEPGLRWTHIVERRSNRCQDLYPQVKVLRNAQELWESEVEVAVIVTPNDSHFTLAQQALRAGKHVVVDKPFTLTSAEADQLIALSEEVGRCLTVFHNRRWDGDFLTIRQLLQEGTLGRLHRYESRWERYRPLPKGGWREQAGPGHGILYDLGSHMIDQVLQLFGRPRAVWAHLQQQRPGVGATDAFDWIGDYGHMQAHLSSNCLTPSPSFRFSLIGDRETFLKSGLDPQEDALQAGRVPGGPDWGCEPPDRWGLLLGCAKPVPTHPGDYPQFYRNLVAALRGEQALAVQPQEARDVIRALELAEESHRLRGWIDWS